MLKILSTAKCRIATPVLITTVGIAGLFPCKALTAAEAGQWTAASKKIDSLLQRGYEEHDIKANPEVGDEVFLRRVYLDIIGRIPSLAEAREFIDSKAADKRPRLIERLLSSEGYVSHYYNFWADILRINSALGNGAGPAESAYRLWVKSALRENKPYDQFVRELVSARGHLWDNGAIGYYMRDRGMPLDNMSNTVRIFLGTRLECAQCHNHPFDKWTQMDYFKMAAFSYNVDANRYQTDNRKVFEDYTQKIFREQVGKLAASKYKDLGKKEAQNKAAQEVRRQRDAEYTIMRQASADLYRPIRYTSVSENKRSLRLPHDYQYDDAKPKDKVTAAVMFGEEIDLEKADDPVDAYAEWMTSPDSPTFTKVIANRLWKKVFGVGIIEPVDELSDQTVASNAELLAYLEELMRELNYDMRAYLQTLYNTKAYQRQAHNEEIIAGVPYYFPGPILRRMSAEQVWDSLIVMLIDDPDHYQPRFKNDLSEIERQKQSYESLEERSPEEYLEMMKEVAKVTGEIRIREDKVREAYQKARQGEDAEEIRKLSLELREFRRETYDKISEVAYNKLSKGGEMNEMMANLGMTSSMMDEVRTQLPKPKTDKMNIPKMDPAVKSMGKAEREAYKEKYAKEKKQLAKDARDWSRATSEMARASELQSPARRGHFLREFGQSDRETIENANGAASVPQALNLLNGPIAEMLTNANSVFTRELGRANTPEEKIRKIYLTMLTREPTAAEMETLLAEVEASGEQGYDNIVWALLNTQQFMFVM
jgi:hypothetical protein